MNIFHGQRSIDIDNGTKTGINATKLNIKCGQNLVRIKHNQRQDKNISIMRENNQLLERLAAAKPGVITFKQHRKNSVQQQKLKQIVSRPPHKENVADRSFRTRSVSAFKKMGHGFSLDWQTKEKGEETEDTSSNRGHVSIYSSQINRVVQIQDKISDNDMIDSEMDESTIGGMPPLPQRETPMRNNKGQMGQTHPVFKFPNISTAERSNRETDDFQTQMESTIDQNQFRIHPK